MNFDSLLAAALIITLIPKILLAINLQDRMEAYLNGLFERWLNKVDRQRRSTLHKASLAGFLVLVIVLSPIVEGFFWIVLVISIISLLGGLHAVGLL
jgi:hypothetical protein